MIDIQLLRLMRVRSDFNKVRSAIDINTFDTKTRKIIRCIDKYYRTYPSHGQIEFESFIPLFDRLNNDMHSDDAQVYKNIIKNMAKAYPDAATREGIMLGITEHHLVHELTEAARRYVDGDDVDVVEKVTSALEKFKLIAGANEMPEVSDNIDDLLDGVEDDNGIKFRLECLRESMRGLAGGDFIILAARPDQGKTSFTASEISYMALQVPIERPILWLNNEGNGQGIQMRVKQAALNATVNDLVAMKDAGDLYQNYYDAVGGKDKIIVMNIHGYSTGQVEALIENLTPSIVIYDMIDNIKGFGDAARTDLRLEKLYQWAREIGVKYDVISIATSQISGDAADMQFPPMTALKDSKTGKQGACDAIIMIGSIESKPEEYGSVRWVSAPKNKLRRFRGKTLHHRVNFNRDKALFTDVGEDAVIKDLDDE